MVNTCAYCGRENSEWKSGVTYTGLDLHHNPPEFLFRRDGKWEGKKYLLCREHHVELHRMIKLILNRIAGTMKFVNSEEWLCNKMNLNQIRQARKEIYDYTEGWINGNTSTITK